MELTLGNMSQVYSTSQSMANNTQHDFLLVCENMFCRKELLSINLIFFI